MLHFPWINSISWFWVSPVYFSYTQHTHAHKHTHVYSKIHVSIWKTYQKKIGVLLSTARKYFLEGKLTRVCLCHEYKIVRVEFWYVCKFYDGFIFNCTLYKQTYTHTHTCKKCHVTFFYSFAHSFCLSFFFVIGVFFFLSTLHSIILSKKFMTQFKLFFSRLFTSKFIINMRKSIRSSGLLCVCVCACINMRLIILLLLLL